MKEGTVEYSGEDARPFIVKALREFAVTRSKCCYLCKYCSVDDDIVSVDAESHVTLECFCQCHRYPPVRLEHPETEDESWFPVVSWMDWCGEYDGAP